MITASDVYAEYLALTPDEEGGGNRNDLARVVDSLIMSFASMRKMARDALWASAMLLLCACTAQTISAFRFDTFAILLTVVLISGVLAVPYTVHSFRKSYRRVLDAYRKGHGLPAGIRESSAQPRHPLRVAFEKTKSMAALARGGKAGSKERT